VTVPKQRKPVEELHLAEFFYWRQLEETRAGSWAIDEDGWPSPTKQGEKRSFLP